MPLIEKEIQEPTVTIEDEPGLRDDLRLDFLKSKESSVKECARDKEH